MPKQRTPARTPLQDVTEVGTHRGRRILAATYPSATEQDATGNPTLWVATFDDSGHPIGCTCRAVGTCWHLVDAANATIEFYKRLHTKLGTDLAKEAEHLARYLSFPQDQDERESAELQAIAVATLQREQEGRAA